MADRNWTGTTYGNGWMHKHLIRLLHYIPVQLLYLFSAIFIIPVVLCVNPSRKTSYHYFRLRLGYGKLRALWSVYRNHCQFAQNVIDKFAMYAGKRFNVEVDGFDLFHSRETKDEGFIHMSAHIGNYEIAGYTLHSDRKRIYAVLFGYEKETVMKNRSVMFGPNNISMIGIKEDMSHLFEIDKAICNGDIVSFPTDRTMGESKHLEIDFLGAPAIFPMGPFSVATMRGLDVLAVNVMKTGLTSYKVYITALEYDRSLPRKQQIRQLGEAYVRELEKRVRQYPLQWYNFFEFWKEV